MLSVDLVSHAAREVFSAPRLHDGAQSRGWACYSAMGKNFPRPGPRIFGKLGQLLANLHGWSCAGLSYIDVPVRIGCVGDIDSDSSKSVRLLLGPPPTSSETEPAPCYQQSAISVNVKSLLGSPSVGACAVL